MSLLQIGPTIWASIHILCFSAPGHIDENARVAYSLYLQSLADILPCQQCRIHFQTILKEHPINNEDPFTWSVKLHNIVNEALGKPSISIIEAHKFWSKYVAGKRCSECSKVIDPKKHV